LVLIKQVSVKLWNDYFLNGNIYAVDVLKLSDIQYDDVKNMERVTLLTEKDAQFLTDDGILVCEDVQSIDHVDILKSAVPENLKEYIKVFDIRNQKGRWVATSSMKLDISW